jgi:hypothetical protein
MSLSVRLSSKAVRNAVTGCLEWIGAKNNYGYGRLMVDGKNVLAHRVSYEVNVGQIPAGYDVCHKCDNRKCIEPAHLFAGTRKANMADCVSKDRQSRGEHRPLSKLTTSEVSAIRNDSRTQREIAKDFGVAQQQVSRIKTGKQWSL